MLKIYLKRIVLVVLAGLGYLILLPLCKRKGIRVIRYHSVSDFRKHEVNVKVKIFKRQIEYLSRKYNVISLEIFLKYLNAKKEIPKNSIMITFDDGYRDNYTNAYLILRKYKLPAVIFLSAGYINTDRVLPHDMDDKTEYNRLLGWNEIKQMLDNKIDFGSHTLHHANLGKCSKDNMKKEIKESKILIEKNIECEVKSISYPFGLLSDFNKDVIGITENAGYECGVTAIYGINTKKADRYKLYRIGIESSDTMFTFKAKLNGTLDILMWIERPVVRKIISKVNKVLGAS